jgi:hypothetical protein
MELKKMMQRAKYLALLFAACLILLCTMALHNQSAEMEEESLLYNVEG